jgi:hypothetical protein
MKSYLTLICLAFMFVLNEINSAAPYMKKFNAQVIDF